MQQNFAKLSSRGGTVACADIWRSCGYGFEYCISSVRRKTKMIKKYGTFQSWFQVNFFFPNNLGYWFIALVPWKDHSNRSFDVVMLISLDISTAVPLKVSQSVQIRKLISFNFGSIMFPGSARDLQSNDSGSFWSLPLSQSVSLYKISLFPE